MTAVDSIAASDVVQKHADELRLTRTRNKQLLKAVLADEPPVLEADV